MSYQLNSI